MADGLASLDKRSKRSQRSRGSSRADARAALEASVLAPAAPSAAPREIEALLQWVVADQLALSGGAGAGVFTGYGAPGLQGSAIEVSGSASAGLKPLRPRVHPYADWVAAGVFGRLSGAAARLVKTCAARRVRPPVPDPPRFVHPDKAHVNPATGRPMARYIYGPWGKASGRRGVETRRIIGHVVVREGAHPDDAERMRADYRTWRAALVWAADSLKARGAAVDGPSAPGLPVEPWEGRKPRFGFVRDAEEWF